MKLRKLLLSALCFIGATAGLVGFAACQTDNPSDHEHKYSENWTYDNENPDLGHWHKCEVEGCIQVSGVTAHTWDNGTATKTATCFAEGEITYKCTVCQATKTETVEKLPHSYSDTWSKDGTNHWHECTVSGCGDKKDTAAHTWNNGEVTQEATCFEEGVTTYTCTVCGQTKTESINMLEHNIATEWSKDGTGHWHGCTTSGCSEKKDTAAHTWSNGVVTKEATCFEEGVTTYTCTVCGQTKTEAIEMIDHTFSEEWSKDSTGHWHACTVEGCNGKDTVYPHTFGEWIDDSRYCEECNFAEAKEHVHSFATEWSKDNTHHWYACTVEGCNEKDANASHTFGDWQTAEDWLTDSRTCSVCEYVETRQHTHSYFEEWSADADNHWHACTEEGCPLTTGEAAHTKVWHSAKGQHWYTCRTCGYVSEKADHEYNSDLLCVCDVPTAGLVYTITDNEAALTSRGNADDTAPLIVIASYVKDVDGVAVPCSADDVGAVPVTSIGKDVFMSFDMVEIYVPATVKTIRSCAFLGCRNLATVRTAAKFTRIEQLAFKHAGLNAVELTGIDLSEAALIDKEAFSYSTISGDIDLSSISAYGLGSKAFENCTLLKSVKIGPKLQRLASGSNFINCTGLESVELECDLQDMGGSVFNGCTNLKTFKYKTIEEIGNYSFKDCKALESFDFTNVGGLINKSFANAGLKSLTIPATMTYTENSFDGNPVKTVTFSEGVTSITTPIGLATIETVNLPSTLTSLAGNLFQNCKALTTINCAKNKDDFISISLANKWDTGLGNCTLVLNDGNFTIEQLFAVEHTQLTELGTVTGTADNTCEYLNLDGDRLYVVYYAYTLTQAGTFTVTVNPADAETCILTSVISFRDIRENMFENPYLGDPGTGEFTSEYSTDLKAGDTVYLAACNVKYEGGFRFEINIFPPSEIEAGENSLTLKVAVNSKTPSTKNYMFKVETGGTYNFKLSSDDLVVEWSYLDENGEEQSGKYDPWNKTPKEDGYYVSPDVEFTAGMQVIITVKNYSTSDTDYTLIIELAQS